MLRAAVRYGVCAVVVCSTLPFGGVRPAAVAGIEIAAAILFAAALLIHRGGDLDLPPRLNRVLFPAAILVGLGVIQWIPLPAAWWPEWIAPVVRDRAALTALVPDAAVSFSPLSISPPDTLNALLRLVAYVLLGLTTVIVVRDERDGKELVAVILATAAFQSLYGSFEYLSGRQHIFGYAKQYYLDEATGTFINRNHFAAYLAMALPFALGWLAGPGASAGGDSWRRKILNFVEGKSSLRVAGAIAAFLLWSGVILSYSRGGVAAALVGTAVVGITLIRGRRHSWLVFLPLAASVVFMIYLQVRAPGERLMELDHELTSETGRLTVWQASTGLVADNPLLGTGYGTYESAFQRVRPPAVRLRWDHAHNDWLQAAVAGGIAVPLLLLVALIPVIRVRAGRFDLPSAPRIISAGAAGSVAAIASQSFVDFSLRIPAVAVLLAVVVGLRAAQWRH